MIFPELKKIWGCGLSSSCLCLAGTPNGRNSNPFRAEVLWQKTTSQIVVEDSQLYMVAGLAIPVLWRIGSKLGTKHTFDSRSRHKTLVGKCVSVQNHCLGSILGTQPCSGFGFGHKTHSSENVFIANLADLQIPGQPPDVPWLSLQGLPAGSLQLPHMDLFDKWLMLWLWVTSVYRS